jgi:glycine dehydrogenase subunit 1
MPFVPHTKHDEQFMLESVGVDSIEALFDEIPSRAKIRCIGPDAVRHILKWP